MTANQNQPVKPVKRLTEGLVSSSLLVSNPSQTSMDLAKTPSNNIPGMFLNIAVGDIDFFDKNPRRQHDEELYAQIKASIRASGVQHPVHITRRPNESRYILAQGGNTRLKIVKELYAETGDSRFASIPCIYIEYTNDEDIQIAHLIENEQRADMVFWDKACAYADIRDMLQAKSADKLGLRKLIEGFDSKGLAVSLRPLSLYFFAADNLCVLGKFCNALSLSKTEVLRKQYNDLLEQLPDVSEPEPTFALFWENTLETWCAEHTEEAELDVPALQEYLQQQFETAYDIESGAEKNSAPARPTERAALHNDDTGSASAVKQQSTGEHPTDDEIQSDSVTRAAVNPQSESITPESEENEFTNTSPALQQAVFPSLTVETQDGRQALQKLHETVIKLANAANIRDFLVFDDKMPYGYMMDLPDFSKPEWIGLQLIDGSLNARHPSAAVIFGYLWQTSGQEELFQSPHMLQKYNPFLSNERKYPVLAEAYRNPELYSQITEHALGGDKYFQNLNLNVYYLMTMDEELGPLLFDYLQAVIYVNHSDALQWPLFRVM